MSYCTFLHSGEFVLYPSCLWIVLCSFIAHGMQTRTMVKWVPPRQSCDCWNQQKFFTALTGSRIPSSVMQGFVLFCKKSWSQNTYFKLLWVCFIMQVFCGYFVPSKLMLFATVTGLWLLKVFSYFIAFTVPQNCCMFPVTEGNWPVITILHLAVTVVGPGYPPLLQVHHREDWWQSQWEQGLSLKICETRANGIPSYITRYRILDLIFDASNAHSLDYPYWKSPSNVAGLWRGLQLSAYDLELTSAMLHSY